MLECDNFTSKLFLFSRLNTNKKLYTALKNVVENGDIIPTDAVDDHVAKLFLFDFEQCGIHLSETERQKVVALNDTILHLGHHFVAGSSTPRYVKESVVPETLRHL